MASHLSWDYHLERSTILYGRSPWARSPYHTVHWGSGSIMHCMATICFYSSYQSAKGELKHIYTGSWLNPISDQEKFSIVAYTIYLLNYSHIISRSTYNSDTEHSCSTSEKLQPVEIPLSSSIVSDPYSKIRIALL